MGSLAQGQTDEKLHGFLGLRWELDSIGYGAMVNSRTRASRRQAELKAMLETRRRELANDSSNKMRDVRTQTAAERAWTDDRDSSESDPQADIDLAVMQMKSETVARIDAALRRLADKTYGNCAECLEPISEERLRALPFAVRCTGCEQAREATRLRRPSAELRSAFGAHHGDLPA